MRIGIPWVCLLAAWAVAEDPAVPPAPAHPAATALATHEEGVRADQHAFDTAVRSLNGRFLDAVVRLLADAQAKGDLDAAVAATELQQHMLRLTNVTVFGSRAAVHGPRICPMPPRPDGEGLAAQAFTSYVGKVSTLADYYNTAASNRQARYLAALDDQMRELTRRGELDAAVQVRDRRAAAGSAGPSRVIVPGLPRPRPTPPAPVREAARPGAFDWEGTVWDWYREGESRPMIRVTLQPHGRIEGARSLRRWEAMPNGNLRIFRDDGAPREMVLDAVRRSARAIDGERTMRRVSP